MASTKQTESELERARAHLREVREGSEQVAESLRGAGDEIGAAVKRRATESPWQTLGVAFAAGFVLGGGLSTGVLRTAAQVGTRIAMTQALLHVAGTALDEDA